MCLTTYGRGDDRRGFGGVLYIHPPMLEYCSTIYRDLSGTGAMSGCGAVARGAGEPTVAGAGQTQL